MPSSPTTATPVAFVCDSAAWTRTACKSFPFFKEHAGKRYCVLHYPGGNKSEPFEEALKAKLDAKDFDFRGVWFPGSVDFSKFRFDAPAYFTSAIFSALANFTSATFDEVAYFRSAAFAAGAYFDAAVFRDEAYFENATFDAETYFNGTTFRAGAYFKLATFRATVNFLSAEFGAEVGFDYAEFAAGANFQSAIFKDHVSFVGSEQRKVFGDNSSLNLQFARVEKPERVAFHTLKLRPHWFVNVDARKFEFTYVDWHWYGRKIRWKLKRQLREKAIPSYVLLAIACRRLAVNAEESNIYWRASSFRYLAMNVERLDTGRGFAFWTVDWWYWLASGFGERISRALVAFLVIWLSFAFIFRLPSPVRCPDNSPGIYCLRWEESDKTRDYFDRFSNSAVYAIEAMTLQKPEPKPASPAAHLAVLLCTLLGPVQAALLALAIRRKVMR